MRSVPTPKTGTGWLWLACAVAVFYMFGLNGPNHKGERIRDEAVAGWNAGFHDEQPDDSPADVALPTTSRLSVG